LTVISLTVLRLSVIWRGAESSLTGSVLPCVRRRNPSSFTFSVLLITWSALLNFIPASASCESSFSTGVPRTWANCLMVTSDIFVTP
jgi:hypothetical protein